MDLLVNSEPIHFEGNSLAELLLAQGAAQQRGIAVALNETVVPKEDWSETHLGEGDRILIIQPTQGG
ncbi:MAG: sulfur carrier protein ThiS [bacterium]|nr:sulfur carrier protein ThiS [bacterium]